MASKIQSMYPFNEFPLYWYNYAGLQNVQECYTVDCNNKN